MRTFVGMLDLCLLNFLHAHIRGMLDLMSFGGFYCARLACLIFMFLVVSTCARSWHT